MDVDSYRVLSRYYDAAYGSKEDLHDIPFYVDLAARIGGPVLEIGCGTGRVLLEIAARGIAVEGLDASGDQLDVLRGKIAQRGIRAMPLHHADMRSFSLDRRYPLIIAPFRPVQHLYSVADQVAAFRAISAHLLPEGLFAFDAFYPKPIDDADTGVEHPDLEWADPRDPGRMVRRSFVRHHVDRLNQVFSGEFIFRVYDGERLVSAEREPLKMSWYTYPQFRLLFALCGFRILEEYGSFQRDPIGICKEMIFVLSRSQYL